MRFEEREGWLRVRTLIWNGVHSRVIGPMKKEFKARSAGARELVLFILLAGSCDASSQSMVATSSSRRGYLSFPDRVAYQYAIEEVRWHHRIWPKDNPGPKPPLDALISQTQLAQKVQSYLRKSQVVYEQRGRPISAGELQAETERMATHSKQPEVLRELFAALGNDPFVIAECLARPVVAERLVAQFNDGASQSSRAESRDPVERPLTSSAGFEGLAPLAARAALQLDSARNDTLENGTYTLPGIAPLDCADNTWSATTTVNAPDARDLHSVVWTGSEMIIWGGYNPNIMNTGGKYDPAEDAWTSTSTVNAPTRRVFHTAVWTGSEVIVWGGQSPSLLNTGGRYNPVADSWAATSIINAPSARIDHTAVWTGREMIVWGGANDTTFGFNNGARYDPGTDTWTATSTTNAPAARFAHSALWTGSEMIIWGGSDSMNYVNTGGRYNPTTDSWTPTGLMNVVPGRFAHTAVWTQSEMIVWGGVDQTFDDCNTGGRYNPISDSWVATSLSNAPSPRDSHTAVWTGNEMIIWAGIFHTTNLNTGGRYNPSTDSWTNSSLVNAPSARYAHTAVWTGTQMIVWGGLYYPSPYLNTGGIYCAQPSVPVLQSAVSRKAHGSAGNFDLALPLSGTPAIECRSGDATNDYTVVITFSASVTVNGSPQASVTSGMGTIGSNGVPNGGVVQVAGNIVTVPLTNVTNAQTIQVTLYGINGSANFVIPMSILVGDTNGNGAVNASDVSLIKSQVGHQLNATNFRSDITANGYIDASDIALVKSLAGTGLP